MKKALAILLAAGFVVGSYATDARVVVLGRHSAFYRDETSVFRNPADISLYPNMLYGSFGVMDPHPDSSNYAVRNMSPTDPFFGGMVSYRFSEEENGPMFSVGAFANRRDYILDDLMSLNGPAGITKPNEHGQLRTYKLKEPVAKVDLIFGYDLGNGLALGLGLYGAYQSIRASDKIVDETSIYKASLGVNYNIDQGLDLEVSANGGMISGIASNNTESGSMGRERSLTLADGEYFWRGDVRFFSAVPAINGSFVPQVSLEYMNLNELKRIDLEGGVGMNMNIDRGFFWAGVQGVYTNLDPSKKSDQPAEQSIGARFSFGIERNIMWDWFLIRVGGQKEVRHVDVGSNSEKTFWVENSGNNPKEGAKYNALDGSDNDLVGLGFGLNIDNRLRIDFVASEDLPYTLTNLVSGNKSHIFNRVSATYRF